MSPSEYKPLKRNPEKYKPRGLFWEFYGMQRPSPTAVDALSFKYE